MLVIYAVGVSFLLHPLGIRFVDSLVFAAALVWGAFRRGCACVQPRIPVFVTFMMLWKNMNDATSTERNFEYIEKGFKNYNGDKLQL